MPDQVNIYDTTRSRFDPELEDEDILQNRKRLADGWRAVTDADAAYGRAIEDIPKEPTPSPLRRILAAGLGFMGGYHSQFVDPRQTAGAVTGILEGDYPQRMARQQRLIDIAKARQGMANNTLGRANEENRALQEAGARRAQALVAKQNAELNDTTKRMAQQQMWGKDNPDAIPFTADDPAHQEWVNAKTHLTVTAPNGQTYIVPTTATRLRSKREAEGKATIRPEIVRSAIATIRKAGLPMEGIDEGALGDSDQKYILSLLPQAVSLLNNQTSNEARLEMARERAHREGADHFAEKMREKRKQDTQAATFKYQQMDTQIAKQIADIEKDPKFLSNDQQKAVLQDLYQKRRNLFDDYHRSNAARWERDPEEEVQKARAAAGVKPDGTPSTAPATTPAPTPAPQSLPQGNGRKLDKQSAIPFFNAAGGDPAKARELARQAGWSI